MDLKVETIVLGNKERTAGLITVCCLFLLTVIICLKKETKTYDYTFDLSRQNLAAASVEDGYVSALPSSDDYSFATVPFILPAGGYILELSYSSDVASVLTVQGGNDCVFDIDLPETGMEVSTITDGRLIIPVGTDRGIIKLYINGDGQVNIYNIVIHSAAHIYRDYYFIIVVVFIIAAVLVMLLLGFNRLKLSKETFRYLAVFGAVLVLVNIPFMKMSLHYNIDTQGHLKRIEGIMQGLRDGQLPVIIGPNYANEYGELVVLNPSLFLYIPAILRILNVSVPTSYNFFMILVNAASAVSALLCAEKLSGSVRCGIIASVIYLLEPFRLYIMLELGAGAGMGVAMVFLPFVVTGIYKMLFCGGSSWKYLAVGFWGIACSHVVSFAMAIIFVFIYTLINIRKLREKQVVISIAKAVLLFLVLSAGTLAPFLGYYFTKWNRNALAWTDFYHFPIETVRELINVSALIILTVSWAGIRKTGRFSEYLKHFLISGSIIVLMSTPVFPWAFFGKIPFIDSFLSMVQYPFRIHLMAVPFIAVTAAVCLLFDRNSKNAGRKAFSAAIMLLLLFGAALNFYLYQSSKVLFETPVSGEINTLMEDYLPEGTLTEWYENDTGEFSNYETIQAYSYEKEYTSIDLTYTCPSEGEYMEFPLFYYDGYMAFDQDGRSLMTEKGNRNRVRVYLTRSDEIQELHVRFVVKKLYTVLFIFSLTAGIVWFSWNIGYRVFRAAARPDDPR